MQPADATMPRPASGASLRSQQSMAEQQAYEQTQPPARRGPQEVPMDVSMMRLGGGVVERSTREAMLWRKSPEAPTMPTEAQERTNLATAKQCLNARVPGYSGFIPSTHSEDIYGFTQANTGIAAVREQSRQRAFREEAARTAKEDRNFKGTLHPVHSQRAAGFGERSSKIAMKASQTMLGEAPPESHPHAVLGNSRMDLTRNHWVPTIPGYGGYIPAKEPENVVGGGMTHTCRLAGKAIAARDMQPDATITDASGRQLSEQERLANHLRQHCTSQIPGYMGHIPRIHGDTIYGAGQQAANRIAASMCDDKIANPENHCNSFCGAVKPPPRKLRGIGQGAAGKPAIVGERK
eukprot:gnl/TRDRNA2_/TRDRNA2_131197_c0_seq3.p1 gnl/TRDRNA2_/TRDRNA2_131197_c0~~gnl/TRDRNA2_/TRDRNA2_131197_c0_seq3.p1  ORF type:complete len:351 (+),score=70.29 gnl/TRDRNA2_/TRDRNA2_131197_c0_seq3:103-1155(+)